MTQIENAALRIAQRPSYPNHEAALTRAGLHPLLARLMASRGVEDASQAQTRLSDLLPPHTLKGLNEASEILAEALTAGAKIIVVGDYDCDGATATAVAVRGLRMLLMALGAQTEQAQDFIQFVVPNRFDYGYGLSPEIVQWIADNHQPDLLVTVDNGISSIDGVNLANDLGIGVIVTDHHLPGEVLPEAQAIVNPNQPGCPFPSKHIAGVGVMFYTLMACRAKLRELGELDAQTQPRLDSLLDLVALGTVADVVRLDANNRTLVAQGVERIRQGRAAPGLLALFHEAGKDYRKASAQDLGFYIGPRLNAAGRLDDMTLGIQALIEDQPGRAGELAAQLGAMNEQRKRIENDMKQAVEGDLEELDVSRVKGLVLARPDWHQGVIGILASRMKDRFHRPTFALAPGGDEWWKGSGRSIPGIHLRDVVDLAVRKLPAGSVPKFGGHAMAAGLTIHESAIDAFKSAFDEAVGQMAEPHAFERSVQTDGSLPTGYLSASVAEVLSSVVWGQGFPAPIFCDEFEVLEQRLLKQAHSKFSLKREGKIFTALRWRSVEPIGRKVKLVYRFEKDDYQGGEAVQLIIEHAQSLD